MPLSIGKKRPMSSLLQTLRTTFNKAAELRLTPAGQAVAFGTGIGALAGFAVAGVPGALVLGAAGGQLGYQLPKAFNEAAANKREDAAAITARNERNANTRAQLRAERGLTA